MTRRQHPATITATVDRLDGVRIVDAALPVLRVVRLNCGCDRYECSRPGGGDVHVLRGARGDVHVLRGAHCERVSA